MMIYLSNLTNLVKSLRKKKKNMSIEQTPGYNDPKNLHVLIIKDDTESLTEALGITPERYEAIKDLTVSAFRKTDKLSEAMVVISKEIKHINEYSMCMLMLQQIIEGASGRRSGSASISGLSGKLKGGNVEIAGLENMPPEILDLLLDKIKEAKKKKDEDNDAG